MDSVTFTCFVDKGIFSGPQKHGPSEWQLGFILGLVTRIVCKNYLAIDLQLVN